MGEAPECEHGPRVYVSALSKFPGQGLWHAWGCATKECNGPKGSDTAGLIFVDEPKEGK